MGAEPGRRARHLAWATLLAFGGAIASGNWLDVPERLRPPLSPFAERWAQIDDSTRARLLARAERWQALPPAEQARRLDRLARWQALSPAQRAALRLNLPYWRALAPDRQRALVERLAGHAARSPSERARREAEFEALSPAERRALLPSPGRSELEALARRSFAFVPPEAQEATLEMLASLGPQARQDLETLSRRLAPWQREALREELLALPAAERAAWLRERARSR